MDMGMVLRHSQTSIMQTWHFDHDASTQQLDNMTCYQSPRTLYDGLRPMSQHHTAATARCTLPYILVHK